MHFSILAPRRPWRLVVGLAALLATQPIGAAAQAPADTLIYDTFRNGKSEWAWSIGSAPTQLAEMSHGSYRLRCVGADATNTASATLVVSLNDEQDWSFAARLRVQNRGGLYFGFKTNGPPLVSNYQVFTLELNRPVPVAALWHYDGKWAKEFALPLPAGFDAAAEHTLQVARQGTRLRYYVDEQLLSTDTPAPRLWPGPSHDLGFYAENVPAEVVVSQVLIKHHSRIRLAPGVPRQLRRERLGNGISSTPGEEIDPVVSADGRALFFTRSLGDPDVPSKSNTDIFRSERQADGSWGPPQNLGRPVNTDENNTTVSVSPDGQSVVVTRLYNEKGQAYSNNGISTTIRQADGSWSLPVFHSKITRLPDAGEYSSRTIDASGQISLVSSDRTSTPHQSDLYLSHRQPDGSWGELVSLGTTINTVGTEQAPFLAPDGKTLYFGSNGHPGYGSVDVFVSHRLDDSWTKWSEPLNLGPSVNTPRYDSYFSLPASGEYAYLMSKEPGAVPYDTDIYRLLLPPSLQPSATELVKGRVLDARTGQPVGTARLRYERLPDGQQQGDVRVAADGTFAIALPDGALYGFRAEAPGYVSASNNLDLTDAKAYGEVTQDVYLLPLTAPVEPLAAKPAAVQAATPATGQPLLRSLALPAPREEKITLNNVFFVQGKPVLLPSSFPELTRLAQTLQENPTLRIRLDGHTDNTGDAKDPKPNQLLSEQRADAIKTYLVKRSVAQSRLETQGFGGSRPVAPNDTEANKRKNRRVEFVIVSR